MFLKWWVRSGCGLLFACWCRSLEIPVTHDIQHVSCIASPSIDPEFYIPQAQCIPSILNELSIPLCILQYMFSILHQYTIYYTSVLEYIFSTIQCASILFVYTSCILLLYTSCIYTSSCILLLYTSCIYTSSCILLVYTLLLVYFLYIHFFLYTSLVYFLLFLYTIPYSLYIQEVYKNIVSTPSFLVYIPVRQVAS